MAIDFGREKERLRKEFEENAKFVKIEDGQQYRLLFLDDGNEPHPQLNWDDTPMVVDFVVELEGKIKTLTVKLKSRLYNTLVDYGAKAGGLAGALLVITRDGQLKKTKYSIVEVSRGNKPAQ